MPHRMPGIRRNRPLTVGDEARESGDSCGQVGNFECGWLG